MEWPGTRRNGYALIQLDGQQHYAHRLAWELFNGPLPEGEGYHGTCVCHHCDNRPCVNLEHLFIGSQKDNLMDADSKDRLHRPVMKGTAHPRATLTDGEARMVRQLADEGRNQSAIADLFGVTQTTVSAIKRRKRWGHLE
jgi:hypothetical protein